MAKTSQNFEMFAGDHKDLIYTVESAETLQGVTISWKMAKNFGTDPLIVKTSNDSAEISIEENVFTVFLDPEDTENIETDWVYYHEAEFTDGEGNVYTVATGTGKFYPTLIK